MKKIWKRLIAVAVATLMLISMLPAAVMAAGDGSPTIDYGKKGSIEIIKHGPTSETYIGGVGFTLYKIATLTQAGYSLDVMDVEGFENADDLLDLTTEEQRTAADAFSKKVSGGTKGTTAAETGSVKFANLELGYYLVVETSPAANYVACSPFFVAVPSSNNASDSDMNTDKTPATEWVYDIVARPKNKKVDIDKKIVDEEGNKVDSITGEVGATINYEISSTVPSYTEDYFNASTKPVYNIYDELSDGLDFVKMNDSADVKIKVMVKGQVINSEGNYKLTTNGRKFTVEFTQEFLTNSEYKGQPLTITYAAIVNKDAVVGLDGNTNTVKLDYSNKPGETSSGNEPGTTPKVYTYGLKLAKKDADKVTPLAGAEFKLYDDANTQITGLTGMDETKENVFSSDNDGMITISGLKPGTYYLEETKSPAGYTLLKDRIKVVITATEPLDGSINQDKSENITVNLENSGYGDLTVINNKGFTLPETGGMGTYIFTIGGVILMAGAIILLLTMKKKKDA